MRLDTTRTTDLAILRLLMRTHTAGPATAVDAAIATAAVRPATAGRGVGTGETPRPPVLGAK
jgi:hypothetical protein